MNLQFELSGTISTSCWNGADCNTIECQEGSSNDESLTVTRCSSSEETRAMQASYACGPAKRFLLRRRDGQKMYVKTGMPAEQGG